MTIFDTGKPIELPRAARRVAPAGRLGRTFSSGRTVLAAVRGSRACCGGRGRPRGDGGRRARRRRSLRRGGNVDRRQGAGRRPEPGFRRRRGPSSTSSSGTARIPARRSSSTNRGSQAPAIHDSYSMNVSPESVGTGRGCARCPRRRLNRCQDGGLGLVDDRRSGPSEGSDDGERDGRRRRRAATPTTARANRERRRARCVRSRRRSSRPAGATRRAARVGSVSVSKMVIAVPPVRARREAPHEPWTRAHPRCRPRFPSRRRSPRRRGRRSTEERRSRADVKEAASTDRRGWGRRRRPALRPSRRAGTVAR